MFSLTTFSTLSVEFCKNYLRIEEDFDEDDQFIQLCIEAGKAHLLEYSGLTPEELDEIPYATIILLKMVSEMYTNKTMTVLTNKRQDTFANFLMSKIRDYTI